MWSAISLEPMTEDEAHTLIGALLPADSALSDHDRRRMTREAGGSPFVLEQLARYAGVSRMEPSQAPTFAEMFDTRLGALSPDARRFLETLAICGRPMAPELICDACGDRARAAVARGDAPLLPLHSQQRLVGAGRDVSRSDSRGARRADCSRRRAPDPRPHGAGARREAKRRLRGAVRALSRRRRRRERVDSGRPCRREGGRRARLRPRRVLLPAGAGADAGLIRRTRVARKDSPTRSPMPAGRPRPPTPTCARRQEQATRSGSSSSGAAAEQFLIGGHIDRGLDLIRTVLAGMGVSVPRSPRAALLLVVVAARTAALARAGLRREACRRHRRRMHSSASTPAGRRRRD